MRKSVLLAALAVAGCAVQSPQVWRKEGATEEQFRRDQLTCRQYGMQSAAANGLNGNLFVETWIQDEAAKCLSGLGYSQGRAEPAPRPAPVPAGDKCPDSFPNCSWGR